ncbi:uncharacterized protein G2W53_029229 [Senna tora]|uniref:Uncharacterized protein n=1 Tax=Senna tora TaxID=362788 RepID=A0A834T471_9FABA|nr:uncharacterized protein G2W53_029229 [Senna tora]
MGTSSREATFRESPRAPTAKSQETSRALAIEDVVAMGSFEDAIIPTSNPASGGGEEALSSLSRIRETNDGVGDESASKRARVGNGGSTVVGAMKTPEGFDYCFGLRRRRARFGFDFKRGSREGASFRWFRVEGRGFWGRSVGDMLTFKIARYTNLDGRLEEVKGLLEDARTSLAT